MNTFKRAEQLALDALEAVGIKRKVIMVDDVTVYVFETKTETRYLTSDGVLLSEGSDLVQTILKQSRNNKT